MRRRVKYGLLTILLIMCVGCVSSGKVEEDIYKSLFIIGENYDVALATAAEFYENGYLSEENQATIMQYAQIFYASYQGAVDALEAYALFNDAEHRDKAYEILNGLRGILTEMEEYLSKVRKDGSI